MKNILPFTLSLFLFVLQTPQCHAQAPDAIALGESTVALKGKWITIFDNPAGIAEIPSIQAGIYSTQSLWNSPLRQFAIGLTSPLKKAHAIGITVSQVAFEELKKTTSNFIYSTKILPKIQLGFQAKYRRLSLGYYGSTQNIQLATGIICPINSTITFGASLNNLNQTKLNTNNPEPLPTTLKMGISWQPNQKVLLLSSLKKVFYAPLSLNLGIQYHIHTNLTLNTGLQTAPIKLGAGIILNLKKLNLSISSRFTQYTGYQIASGILIKLPNKNNHAAQ